MPAAAMTTRKTAAWLAACIALTGACEGLRTVAYRDIGGIPTACFGETHGIRMGDTFTPEQCADMLATRLERDYGPAVDRCITHPLPPNRKAAYTSITYNIGAGAFCASSVARRENAGDVAGACDALLMWDKVRIAGVLTYWPGLHNRRVKERALCLMPS